MQNHFMPLDCELNFSAIPRKYLYPDETFYASRRAFYAISSNGVVSLIVGAKTQKLAEMCALSLINEYVSRARRAGPFLILNYDVACKCCSAQVDLAAALRLCFTQHRISRILLN